MHTLRFIAKSLVPIILFILGITGCLLITDATSTPSVTHTAVQNFATATIAKTPPVISTITKTPLPTPTWTPHPALGKEQLADAFLKIFRANDECKLPCVWGIAPGKTSWQSVHEKLSPLGQIGGPFGRPPIERYDVEIFLPRELNPYDLSEQGISSAIGPDIWVENNVVVALAMFNSYWIKEGFDYSLSGFLNLLGEPQEIWLNVVLETSNDQPYYYMDLYYPNRGVLISFNGLIQMTNSEYHICPQDIFSWSNIPPATYTWIPNINVSYDDIRYEIFNNIVDWNKEDFLPIERWSPEFNSKRFFEIYKDNNATNCIRVVDTNGK